MTPPGPGRGYIDVTAQFGPDRGPAAGSSLDALLAERRRHGISISLVHHLSALQFDQVTGNQQAEAAADADSGLKFVAVVRPTLSSGEDVEVGRCLRAGAVGFWVEGRGSPVVVGGRGASPETTPNTFDSAPSLRALRAAARGGRPLFIRIVTWGDASAIANATATLGVPVVLVGAHYDHIVDALAAAEQHSHIYLETSGLAHYDAISTVVARIGAARLLLGTGGARKSAGGIIEAVLRAPLPEAERRAILAGNATRLFGLAPTEVDLEVPSVPGPSLDIHTHFMPGTWDLPRIADNDLLPALGPFGTSVAITSAAAAIFADTEAGNAQTVAACASSENQLGLLVVDPNDVDTTRDHIRKWGDRPGIVGIKIHGVWSRTPTASKAMRSIWPILSDYGRPIKIHNIGADWDSALLELARNHPRVPILIAHGGPGFPTVEGAQLTTSTDNVFIELSSSRFDLTTVREAVRLVRPERLLYGSDAPLLDPRFVQGLYRDAGVSDAQLQRVYWSNAAELFKLPVRPPSDAAVPH